MYGLYNDDDSDEWWCGSTTLVISFRFFLFSPFSFYAQRRAHTLFPDDRISHLYTIIEDDETQNTTVPKRASRKQLNCTFRCTDGDSFTRRY